MPDKRCIGCGKAMPPRPTHHGWRIVQTCGKTYRNCGCMAAGPVHALIDDLLDAGRDYPHRFPAEEADDA